VIPAHRGREHPRPCAPSDGAEGTQHLRAEAGLDEHAPLSLRQRVPARPRVRSPLLLLARCTFTSLRTGLEIDEPRQPIRGPNFISSVLVASQLRESATLDVTGHGPS
jgi:hypothetical protein